MTFPGTQAPVTVQIAPGGNPEDSTTWVWTDITTDVRVADGIRIEGGRRDEGSQVDATVCSLTLNNRNGTYSPRNAEGPYFGELARNTPLRVRWDGTDRFVGFVSEWPTRWDITGNDSWVPVVASGVLRRLQQRAKPLLSPLRRRIPSQDGLVAYWPLEDSPGTTRAGATTDDTRAMRVTGFTFEANSDLAGSAPLPTTTAGSSYVAEVPNSVTGEWEAAFCYRMETPTVTNTVFCVQTTGTIKRWHIRMAPTEVLVLGYDSDDALVINRSQSALPTGFYGDWARLHLYAEPSGSDVTWTLRWRGVESTSSTNMLTDTVTGGSVGSARSVYLNTRGSGADELALGHVSIWDEALAGYNAYNSADDGWKDELAESRIVRLCQENGVAITAPGTATDTIKMGPQPVGTLLDAIRDVEATDGGLLYEADGGLAYVNRMERYNPAVWMTLDVDSGELSGVPEPTDDDQRLVNEVLAVATSGSFARAVDEDSVAKVGTYDQEVQVNPTTDSLLPDIASWLVHLGTVDAMRWPLLSVDLARNPALIPTWLTFTPGKRIRVTHTLSQLPGVDIDVLAEGWAETIGPYTYRVELNCVPAAPWIVGELDDTTLGRLDTAGSELAEAVDSTATSFDVDTTSGPAWVTDPAEFPFDITVAGEQMTVSAITPVADDTFTRTSASGWGVMDSGQTWTHSGGAATDFQTNGSLGYTTHSATGTRKFSTVGSMVDSELVSQIKISATPVGSNVIGGLVSRYTDDSNSYHCWLVFTTTDGLHLTIAKRVASTFTTLATVQYSGTFPTTTFLWIRFRTVGATLSARMWQDGQVEPGGYRLQATDSSFTGAGAVGMHSVLLSGNTSFPTFSWDNFTTVTPQTFTVTRSVNTVTKSHSAGTAVSVAQPLILAR